MHYNALISVTGVGLDGGVGPSVRKEKSVVKSGGHVNGDHVASKLRKGCGRRLWVLWANLI